MVLRIGIGRFEINTSGQGPVAASYKHNNEPYGCVHCYDCFTSCQTLSFSRMDTVPVFTASYTVL
jgi:hypothetical protein